MFDFILLTFLIAYAPNSDSIFPYLCAPFSNKTKLKLREKKPPPPQHGKLFTHSIIQFKYLCIHLVDCGHKDAVELVHVVRAPYHHVVHVQVRDHIFQRPERKRLRVLIHSSLQRTDFWCNTNLWYWSLYFPNLTTAWLPAALSLIPCHVTTGRDDLTSLPSSTQHMTDIWCNTNLRYFLTWRRPRCRLRCCWCRARWPRVGTPLPRYATYHFEIYSIYLNLSLVW